jgi:organic radical activating enzyme
MKTDKILKASDAAKRPDYVSTVQDRCRLKIKANSFKLSGDGVFHTIQGEGNSLGYPITFVRLHFCNLKCTWCDTFYTWQTTSKEYYREPTDCHVDDLLNRIQVAQQRQGVQELIKRVCFTGGEPLIQQNTIAKFLKRQPDFYAEIETNGTIGVNAYILGEAKSGRVKFNCSPKLENSGNSSQHRTKPRVIQQLVNTYSVIFKFVCRDNTDIDEVLNTYGPGSACNIPMHLISIMPEGVTKEENAQVYEQISDKILSLGLATHPRLQNIMFDGAKRAV